jgi:hypothetical protein
VTLSVTEQPDVAHGLVCAAAGIATVAERIRAEKSVRLRIM